MEWYHFVSHTKLIVTYGFFFPNEWYKCNAIWNFYIWILEISTIDWFETKRWNLISDFNDIIAKISVYFLIPKNIVTHQRSWYIFIRQNTWLWIFEISTRLTWDGKKTLIQFPTKIFGIRQNTWDIFLSYIIKTHLFLTWFTC